MNRSKWMIFCGIIFMILLIAFRGLLYRTAINYTNIETRKSEVLTNQNLIDEINLLTEGKVLDIEHIIKLSNRLTSEKLKFTFQKSIGNPNKVLVTKNANCVGYAALFNAIGNHLLEKQKLTNKYEFSHLVGKLEIFDCDIHELMNDSFFNDHDYNQIRNKVTDERLFVDPSLRDYFGIERVSSF